MSESPAVTSRWLAERISEPTAAGIAAGVARLVRQGALAPQTRLPTVRALAPRLGVSPATVSAAWAALRKQEILAGGGRAGTWVLGGLAVPRPLRYENVGQFWPSKTLNLSRAVPDPALLPDLRPAVEAALSTPDLHSYDVTPITDELQAAVAAHWPAPAQSWLAVNGGYEGLLLVLQTSALPGEHVAVEEPATPRMLDIMDRIGARVLPVATDDDGPLPDSLARALVRRPAAFVHQPRSTTWRGACLTPARRDELALVLAQHGTLVVEDDGLGDLSGQPYAGVAAVLPEQSVLVRSYSKSHSPDLRLAVLAGARDAVERTRVYRQFGAGWSSRLLQNTLAWSLTDPASRATVDLARETYRQRRESLAARLAERGVPAHARDGLAVWVPVHSEHEAMLVLASHGLAVASGEESWSGRGPGGIRVATGVQLPHPDDIADALALAVRAR